jgi:hypothetical protein
VLNCCISAVEKDIVTQSLRPFTTISAFAGRSHAFCYKSVVAISLRAQAMLPLNRNYRKNRIASVATI